MYVRGKYGKSLKLDTLRKDTLEGEAMALAASTRGSYKLAAAAAAAAAASSTSATSGGNSNASSSGSSKSSTTSTTTTKAAIVTNNNNNNNIKNNNEKVSKSAKGSSANPPPAPSSLTAPPSSAPLNLNPYVPHHLNDMEALSMAGLAAGLGGFNGMVNPYLSYFCDFSFPVPGLMPPNGPAPGLGGKPIRPTEKKANDLHRPPSNEKTGIVSNKHRVKDIKGDHSDVEVDVKTDDDEGPSPLPLRLGRSLIQSPLDMAAQPGQV